MKLFFRVTLALLIGFSFASAISITDYKVPVSSATSLYGGFNYAYTQSDTITTADNGSVSLNYNKFYYSLPVAYYLSANGLFTRDGLKADDSTYTYSFSSTAQANKYFLHDLFGYSKLTFDFLNTYTYPALDIILGVGYGRFINATPLARAIRVNEELIWEDVLTDDLNDQELVEFAKLLSPEVMASYKEKYDHWEREYYKAIEKMLQKTKKLANNELGSVGTMVINDILKEFISDRYYGYELSAGVGYEILTPDTTDARNAFLEINANSAYPIGLKSQFIEMLRYTTPLTGDATGKEHEFMLKPSYSYEVSNRIDFITAYILEGLYQTSDTTQASLQLSHALELRFNFYIVNRLMLSTTFNLTKDETNTSQSFNTGLTYRFK